MSTTSHPLMPKATAVWLVDNTSLSFEQIAEFCGMHLLEIKGIADGDVAQGVRGKNPVTSGELSRDEISRAEKDPDYRLKLLKSKVKIPEIKTKKRPRYTPVSRRQDRPNAVLWLLRNHGELKDSQIMRLVGTTKPTIGQIRDRSHWNSANLVPQDPVMLGLCAQVDLDLEVEKAAKRVDKERAAMGLPPLEASETLLPTAETTGYDLQGRGGSRDDERPTAENIFGAAQPKGDQPSASETEEAEEAARVFAKLQDIDQAKSGASEQPDVEDPFQPQPKSDQPDVPAGPFADLANLVSSDDTQPAVNEGAEQPDVSEPDPFQPQSKSEQPDVPSGPFGELASLVSGGDEQPAGDDQPAVDEQPAVDSNQAHYDAVKKYVPDYDEAVAKAIVRHLGIALRSRDASLVACSSKEELERVRESWCKKKLGMTESDDALDQMIKAVCETMKADHQKNRVVFYYLLAKNADRLGDLA